MTRKEACSIGGRSRTRDLTGQVFGDLTVVSLIGYRHVCDGARTRAEWLCQCSCGVTRGILARDLCNGQISCGHIKRRTKTSRGASGFNGLYKAYRKSAEKRQYTFDLTPGEAKELFSRPCFYCGLAPKQHTNHGKWGDFIYNGIDRVINSIGYCVENCVSCCRQCNVAKGTQRVLDFIEWAARTYAHCRRFV